MMTRWRINGSPTSKQPKTGSGGKCLLLTFGLLALTAGMAFGRSGKISKDLENADPGATVDVIIQFSERPSKQDHQRVFDKGGRLKKELPVVKGAVYSIPVSALEDLANNSNVAYISSDRRVEAALDLAASAVNANMAWQFGWDGTGVGIAVIDSGIVSAADLTYSNSSANNPRIVYSQNFADSSANTSDLYGHGTHVAGILAGNATNSTGQNYSASFKGIAPNALLINLRALDQNGSGTDSTVIAAIQQAINLKTQYNIRVINLSLGRPVFESYALDPLCQAVEAAWKAGMVVAVAAGNYGRDNSMGTYGYGTITATPMVSGAAALLLQAQPQLTPDQVKARLMKTAYKAFPSFSIATDPVTGAIYVSQYDIFTIGAGYLDIAAALSNSDLATRTALSPTALYNPASNTVSLVSDPSAVWDTSVVWGTSEIWGTSVFLSGTSVLWGSSVVWGASGTQGFSVIWGTSVVWGTTSQTASEGANIAISGEN